MSVPEIRHEKINVTGLKTKEIMAKYNLKYQIANRAVKKGYFIKNYSTPEIVIDPNNFNVRYAYNLAGKVFWRNFSRYPGAIELMPDLIQEGVKRLWELSGKIDEKVTEKYNRNYQSYWIVHNSMLSFWKSYQKSNRVIEKCKNMLLQYPVFSQKIFFNNYEDIEFGDLSVAKAR